jgi:uncharacterized protein YecT (DUF1311 family)
VTDGTIPKRQYSGWMAITSLVLGVFCVAGSLNWKDRIVDWDIVQMEGLLAAGGLSFGVISLLFRARLPLQATGGIVLCVLAAVLMTFNVIHTVRVLGKIPDYGAVTNSRSGAAAVPAAPAPSIFTPPVKPLPQQSFGPGVSPPSGDNATEWSPSFDCAKVSNGAERLICSNRQLSELDVQLSQEYSSAVKRSTDSAALKDEQRRWISRVRGACSSVDCLSDAYKIRLSELRQR